ncbi:MAG: hypothetical protein U0441_27050 [Polyangiaceae bacterium]
MISGAGAGTTTTTGGTGGAGGSASCPGSPQVNQACSSETAHCEYGQECCDGSCYPEEVCDCASGTWSCYFTDACFIQTGGSGGGTTGCDSGPPDDDADGDGYNELQGDCNDCDPSSNPGAAEVIAGPDENGVIPNPGDEDCDGLVDNLDPDLKPCDAGLALDSADPMDAAKAIGMCATKDGVPKFVQTVSWVLADGSAPGVDVDMAKYHLGHGLLDHFGTNDKPQEGERMLALSTGTARNKEEPGFVSRNYDKGYSSPPPALFTGVTAGCPGVTVPTDGVQDAAALQIEGVTPTNATGFEFRFHYRTYDFPQYSCTPFADFFWSELETEKQGQLTMQNIALDPQGFLISANATPFAQCGCPAGAGQCTPPGGPMSGCSAQDLLVGTDYDGSTNGGAFQGWTNAGTGWIENFIPVEPNTPFKLRFTVFDSGNANGAPDHNADSIVTVDSFQWQGKPGAPSWDP